MDIVDAQFALWEAPTAEFPWEGADFGKDSGEEVEARTRAHQLSTTNSIDEALAAMDAVGVATGIVFPPFFYGYRIDYAVAAAERHPGRFAATPQFDHRSPALEERLREFLTKPGIAGVRVVLLHERHAAELRGGAYDGLWAAAERLDVPVAVFCPRLLDDVGRVARSHPELRLVIDHFGLVQPPYMDRGPEPFADLPRLLSLARFANVAVKFSGAPTLSDGPFPFDDVWPALERVVEAFGPERLVWASDYPRVANHTYAEALAFVAETHRLSQRDKEWILGRSARRIFRLDRPRI